MKPLCGIISAFAISVCLCVGAQAASVLNDRFTVSLPEGFKGQDPQTIGMNTKWTYVRERAPDNQDYRFRVTVLEGSKPLPDDSTGANVALGLLVSFTAQQTKSLTGLQFDAAKRTVLQGRVWWHTTWTGQGGKVQITGMSCIMHAYGADYFLVFESLAPEGESRLRNEILNSFEPRKPADQTPGPAPGGAAHR